MTFAILSLLWPSTSKGDGDVKEGVEENAYEIVKESFLKSKSFG